MGRNNLIKKGLIVAVILLFIGIAFAPSINADISKIPIENELKEKTSQIILQEKNATGYGAYNVFYIAFIRGSISYRERTSEGYLYIEPTDIVIGALWTYPPPCSYAKGRIPPLEEEYEDYEDWTVTMISFFGFVGFFNICGIGILGEVVGWDYSTNVP